VSAPEILGCDQVRDALAAGPSVRTPAVDAHLSGCEACRAYAAEMSALDAKLLRALRVPVPAPRSADVVALESRSPASAPPGAPRAAATSRRFHVRQFALAASVAAVAVLAGALWFAFPRDTLAGDVVAHMAEEPQAWRADAATVPAASVAYVLSRAGVRLGGGSGPDVTYASACWFRGRFVAHLAVRSAAGPVTVLVLPAEHVEGRRPFASDGYRGVLAPAPRGSIAVLTRDGAPVEPAVLDSIAASVAAAVRYD
jgi:predicted anti-sigma-YlaC factor YlaD